MGSHVERNRPLLQIAPMMEVTYRDFRYFMRLLTRRAQLWTEMVVDDTVLHNLEPEKCNRFLGFHPVEHPIVCQLGGSDPKKLAEAAQVVARYGYDEVNLNVGCPSSRVASKGEFGCSLMTRPEVVRDIVHEMSRAVQIPVTVKCRLGVDHQDSKEFTRDFVRTVAQGGCRHFIIHARKAWLNGLSPAQNRQVPPLHYSRVLELCREFPDLVFSLNGGIADVAHSRRLLGFPTERQEGETDASMASAWGYPEAELGLFEGIPSNLHGVMIGRGAMNNPSMLWNADQALYGEPEPSEPLTRRNVLERYCSYLEGVHPPGDTERTVGSVHLAVKPVLGLFSGLRGHRAFRATLDAVTRVKSNRDEGPAFVLSEAMKAVEATSPGIMDEPFGVEPRYGPLGTPPGTPRSTSNGAAGSRKRKGRSPAPTAAEAAVPMEGDPPGDLAVAATDLRKGSVEAGFSARSRAGDPSTAEVSAPGKVEGTSPSEGPPLSAAAA